MLVVGNTCKCACVHVHTMSKRKTKLHPFCHSTSSWNMCVHTLLQPIYNSNSSWWTHKCIYTHLQVHAYHRVHVKVRQEPLGIILTVFPPCLKQDPFAAEFTSRPGEQTSGDPSVSILHLPCMGLQLFMLSYSIHVHLLDVHSATKQLIKLPYKICFHH